MQIITTLKTKKHKKNIKTKLQTLTQLIPSPNLLHQIKSQHPIYSTKSNLPHIL